MKFLRDAFNIGNLYVLLWTTNTFFSLLDIGFDLIRQVSLILCLLMSIFCYVEVLKNGKMNRYLKALNRLFIMFMVYGFILIISYSELKVEFQYQSQPTYWFIEEMMKSILPVFAFYYYAERGSYTKPVLRMWLIVFLVISVYIYMMKASEEHFTLLDLSEDQTVKSFAYIIVAILPGIAVFNGNKLVQASIILVAILFSVIGMKRGAILVSGTCFLWYLYQNMRKSSTWSKIFLAILALVIVLLSFNLFGFMADNNVFFSDRIDATLEGSSSGRDRIAQGFLDYYFNKANIFQQLFGSGAYATIRVGYNFAHNDWLETLICEGLFGVVMFLSYWYNTIRTTIKSKWNREAFLAISLFVIIYLLKTFFSMSINDMSIMSTLFVGYYLSILNGHGSQQRRV